MLVFEGSVQGLGKVIATDHSLSMQIYRLRPRWLDSHPPALGEGYLAPIVYR